MSFAHSLAWMEYLAEVRLGRYRDLPRLDISRCRFCKREVPFLFLDDQGAFCGDPDCESHVLAEMRR